MGSGKDYLVFDGHTYLLQGFTGKSTLIWLCSQFTLNECRGQCYTWADGFWAAGHNHGSSNVNHLVQNKELTRLKNVRRNCSETIAMLKYRSDLNALVANFDEGMSLF